MLFHSPNSNSSGDRKKEGDPTVLCGLALPRSYPTCLVRATGFVSSPVSERRVARAPYFTHKISKDRALHKQKRLLRSRKDLKELLEETDHLYHAQSMR